MSNARSAARPTAEYQPDSEARTSLPLVRVILASLGSFPSRIPLSCSDLNVECSFCHLTLIKLVIYAH